MSYIIILFVYTNIVYITGMHSVQMINGELVDVEKDLGNFSIILLCGILYPAVYETVQMFRNYDTYFEDIGNYVDMIYIWGSIAMSILHMEIGPYAFISKLLMSIVVVLAIRRTFNFLRIFEALSPIVTMLNNVVWELRIFMTFYAILVLLFSLMYGVIGIGNYKIAGKFQDAFYQPEVEGGEPVLDSGAPGVEY